MAEYGRRPQDSGEHRAIVLAGAATAIGLVALARRGTWAERFAKNLGRDLAAQTERSQGLISSARLAYEKASAEYDRIATTSFKTKSAAEAATKSAAENLELAQKALERAKTGSEAIERFSHFLPSQGAPTVGALQALGLDVARSKPMEWLKWGAERLKPVQLLDELGGFRLLREAYGYDTRTGGQLENQIQHLGRVKDLAGLFGRHEEILGQFGVNATAENVEKLGNAHAFYAHGRIFVEGVDKETGAPTFKQLGGRFSLFGRAGASEPRSFIENAVDDLSGRARDPRQLRNQLFGEGYEEGEAPRGIYGKISRLNTEGHALGVKTAAGRKKFREARRLEQMAASMEARMHAYARLNMTPAERRAAKVGLWTNLRDKLDVGYNIRGAMPWKWDYWRDQFENLFHEFNPSEELVGDRMLHPELRYDVIPSLRLDRHGVTNMFLGGRFWRKDRDFNSGTVLMHHLFRRVNDSTARGGITGWVSLSAQSAQSPADLVYNMMMKRALPLTAAAFYANYLNDEIGHRTGERPTDHLTQWRAHESLRWAHYKDTHGWTQHIRHIDELSGGVLGYAAHPFVDHQVGLSERQLRDYYAHGKDPVRKGRWWSFGSSTPFRGERVMYFNPNAVQYARAGNIYQTDTMWGSFDEYYANAAFPTLEHPFAPLRHFLFDRYHWEEKHYRDRPYPVSGPMFEPTTLHGVLLNPTLGRVLKPQHYYHEDEMPYIVRGRHKGEVNPHYRGVIRAMNEQIHAQAASREVSGFVTPSGEITPMQAVALPIGRWRSPVSPDQAADLAQEAAEREDGYARSQELGSYGDGANAVVAYGSAKHKTRSKIRELNAGLHAKASRFGGDHMLEPMHAPGLFGVMDPNDRRIRRNLVNVNDPRYQAGLGYYSLTEIGGIYGFGAVSATGDIMATHPMIADSSRMTSFERTYWDRWNTGGMLPTPALSEAARRFMPHRYHSNSEYNPIRNTMPTWLPGLDGADPAYFVDFLHGDPYTKIPNGEARLPGTAYEKLHGLAASPPGHPGANYSDLTKFEILADVAPWSNQYRYYRDYLTHLPEGVLTDEERDHIQEIKREVSARKKRYNMTPYRLKYAQVEDQNVTVKDVIDGDTFTTYEHPDNPIRLAGVRVHGDASDWIKQYIHPGAHLRIQMAADPTQRISRDTLHTIRAAVYAGGTQINRAAIEGGYGTETQENNPAALRVRYTPQEMRIASFFEWFGHARIPLIHNKFMPIDSPLELYKRTQVYGKDWQDWRHPFKDYLFPSFESFAQQGWMGMVGAAFLGFSLGVGPLKNRLPIALAAMGITEAVHLFRGGHTVPAYREHERDIDEYFDVLKYVKYEGLYERTRAWIKHHQHHDIGALADRYEREGEQRKRRIQVLKEEKRQLIVSGHEQDQHERILGINRELRQLQGYRRELHLTREDVLALQYRTMAKTTLYGSDSHGNLSQVMLAMDPKEREFFQAFLNAAGPEREQILQVVPENERRFLEAAWGMKTEEKPTLSEYFKHHYLPGKDWSGWRAESSLDDYKLVVMKDEGVNLTSHGFWPQDEERVKELGIWDVEPHRPTTGNIKEQLHTTLSGMGLRDIDINLVPNNTGRHQVHLHVKHERKDRQPSY